MTRLSIRKYQNNNIARVEQADPHTLISLIMQHILGNIAAAKGAIERNEIENKNRMLGKVIGLLGELQNSLDMEQGGQLSDNLYSLYGYMISQVTQANINNNITPLAEVTELITEIKSGWDAIPQDIRQQYKNK